MFLAPTLQPACSSRSCCTLAARRDQVAARRERDIDRRALEVGVECGGDVAERRELAQRGKDAGYGLDPSHSSALEVGPKGGIVSTSE
ncbi:MAG: hypothetical protein R2706_19810 [Acidimicrobiales bacterium]